MRSWIVLSFVFIALTVTLVVRKKLRVDFMPKAYSAVGDGGAPATPLAPSTGQPLPTTQPATPPAAVTDSGSALPGPGNMPIPADPPTNAKTQANDLVVSGAPDPVPTPPPAAAPAQPAATAQLPPPPPQEDLPPPQQQIPSANAAFQPDTASQTQRRAKTTNQTSAPIIANPTPQELDPSLKLINSDFLYDPTGRRDAFRPYFSIDQNESSGSYTGPTTLDNNSVGLPFLQPSQESLMMESLEASDVSKFRLLGILWEVNDPKAMVVSPGGKTYILHKQTRIGRNNGYVAAIREGEVVVVEVSVDGKTPTTRVLSLQK